MLLLLERDRVIVKRRPASVPLPSDPSTRLMLVYRFHDSSLMRFHGGNIFLAPPECNWLNLDDSLSFDVLDTPTYAENTLRIRAP
jgi:hypothetical protein